MLVGFFFALLAACITIDLLITLSKTPLFAWATWDIEWSNNWLWYSTVDYYGAALCFSAIVMSTEKSYLGVMWTVGFMLLGSPVCCIYITYRSFCFKTLELSGYGGRDERAYGMVPREDSRA